MAFNATSSAFTVATKRTTSFGQHSPAASLLVDKSKAHIRRSTPDSEALASSDDEQDASSRHQYHQPPKSIRRTSNLSDTNSARRSSQGAVDANPRSTNWDLGVNNPSRGNASTTFSPWGGSIWNDHQRNPPARLAELKTSETNPGSSFTNEDLLTSPVARRDSNADGSIPFAIPLQPTLKTYRSQSYSVGQMEDEASKTTQSRPLQAPYGNRNRTSSEFAGMQHRPGRTSMLAGNFSPESSTVLEQVREVADDDETSNISSEAGVRLPAISNRTIEQVAMENMLRQQNKKVHKNAPERSNSFSTQNSQSQRFSGNRTMYNQESVLEEGDDTGYNPEDGGSQTSDPFVSNNGSVENRVLENVKKGHWSSSLGFGGLQDIPQSRRHSFAEVPVRNQHLPSGSDTRQFSADAQALQYGATNGGLFGNPTSFFSSNQMSRSNEAFRPPSSSSSIHQGGGAISQSPAPQLYQSVSQSMQSLYLVTFKAARAEFYYVQEGTGLDVNAGDLVIVEADRGTDLGTVAHKNLDWAMAKELKDKYALEHYQWLMMFSKLKQNSQVSPPGSSGGSRPFGSAVGGMRPHPSNQPPDTSEIKPKMIKRLAQPYEIRMLREKEGNEAKAKRMCQQKVAEHHLNMEILDAEFQMDWKKLTFYYYADAYVNFNNLVTDLFKAYKTRIWMSAINPDSFVSPGPTGMPSFRGRDRFDSGPDPQGNGMMYPTAPEMQQPFNNWQASQEIMPSTMTPSAYSHFFANQAQAYPQMMMQQDFGRGIYPSYRAPSPPSLQQLGSIGRNPTQMNAIYNSQGATAGYPESLKAFQGLSLGP